MDLSARFGENQLRHRRRAGLSQEELCFRADLHRTEIGMLERGIRLPRLDTILKVAGGLEVDPAELLEGMTWRARQFSKGGFDVESDAELAPGRWQGRGEG